jgi:hypothetical protein
METTVKFESTEDFVDFVDHASMMDVLSSARTGWTEGAIAVHDLLQSLSLYIDPEKFWKEFNPSLSGLFFDIGLVCAGHPECWLEPQDAQNRGSYVSTDPDEERRIINIGYNVTTPYNFSKTSIIERGAITAILAFLLEQSGRAVSITQYCSITKNNHNFYGSLVVKPADKQLDMDLLSFWLVSPDSFRKCWMRVLEGQPNARRLGLDNGMYGTPEPSYGSDLSDVFVRGIRNKTDLWTRQNSVDWVCNSLEKLQIKYLV